MIKAKSFSHKVKVPKYTQMLNISMHHKYINNKT